MSDAITGVVRFVHIVTAFMWLGGVFLWNMVIAPRILQRGPPQIRAPFAEAVIPAMTRYYAIAGGLAILSGLVLVGQLAGWDRYASQFEIETGGYGIALTLGAVAAVGMAVVGFGFTAPAGKKMIELMQSVKGPPTTEQQAQLAAQGKKLGILAMAAMLLGVITLVGMVWATNVAR